MTAMMLSPGLRRVEELILADQAHPALAMRACLPENLSSRALGELVRETAALANLRARGPRYVVFGVTREAGGTAAFNPLGDAQHSVGEKLAQILPRYIEPQVRMRYVRSSLDAKSLGVLIIEECKDRPYLVRKDASPVTHSGDAWIRRRSGVIRMRRNDLDKLYAEKLGGPLFDGRVDVRFAGDPPSEFIRLRVSDPTRLPSQQAADKLRALIEARTLAANAAANELTYIVRLSQARILGCDVPYSDKGLATLRMELADVAAAYRDDDERHRLEHAQLLNLQLSLEGACDIEGASFVLHLPANVGISVARANADVATSERTQIEQGRDTIRICTTFERLHAQKRTVAFREPLSIVVDRKAAGHKFAAHYRLHGRNLRYPVSGKLYIVCDAH